MKQKFRNFDDLLEEYLQNPDFALCFLNQALADDDINAFKKSLKDIIKIHGNISAIAKKANVSRGTLYKLMSDKGQPEIGTVLKVFHALGYDVTVTQRQPSQKKSYRSLAA